jgi:hypothetical protein
MGLKRGARRPCPADAVIDFGDDPIVDVVADARELLVTDIVVASDGSSRAPASRAGAKFQNVFEVRARGRRQHAFAVDLKICKVPRAI